ncbi:xaa-Pro aminopeptidase 3 [Sabethes cyaneus]|uniref:xaa-Pro aminopeptidase 3 n=1 Tax=Sabethes cyaneus TaxID=53552 RepID=UPI00237D7507|nr:xaa-Pro aminopeptidase 3 [Sabethes cyaneus]
MNFVRICHRFRPAATQNIQFFNRRDLLDRRQCSSNAAPPGLPRAQPVDRSQESRPVSYGQPMPSTHPHLLQDGELVTGVGLAEIQTRRRTLFELVRKYAKDNLKRDAKEHLIIIPSASKKYMSDKIPYVFRQNSDFLYLSGCLEPDSVLTLELDADGNEHCALFVRPKDSHAELWDGPRTGVELAPEVFGVDRAANVADLKAHLSRYAFAHPGATLWFDEKSCNLDDVRRVVAHIDKGDSVCSPTGLVHKLRVIKSPSEIALMRQTCQIASEAINRTMGSSQPGQSEHQLFAKVDYHCRMAGASYLAYPPVVAGGSNATVIHYINNTQIVRDGEMVLMDAGCEYGGYTSDITRTWPINGNFSEPQRVLYQVLEQVQKELLNCLHNEDGETLDQLFDTMCAKIGKYLQEVGLIPRSLKGLDLSRAAYKFCPHHVSHYLGMDVHDTPLISRSIPLTAGMVCTVEPGIYINRWRKDVPEEFRGLGLRIEDDVLIGSDRKIEVLTEGCVKNLQQIEARVGSSNS